MEQPQVAGNLSRCGPWRALRVAGRRGGGQVEGLRGALTAEVDDWALAGDWTFAAGASSLNAAGGRIEYRFHARDLHLVMGASKGVSPVRFRVLIDGQPPGADHGVDVDEKGYGIATEPRLYQLIRQRQPIGNRRFQIEFLDKGVEAFACTFG